MTPRHLGFRAILAVSAAAFVFSAGPAGAQIANGTISGRITDPQGRALPTAVITATHSATGVAHETVSNEEGLYRLPALPVGTYMVRTRLNGFEMAEAEVTVSVGTNVALDVRMKIDTFEDAVTVEASLPRVSSRENVVDLPRLESLPLNGRQLAEAAATLPGVGLGLHSDPSKNTQRTAQVNGGNGRFLNTIVDGGDNNDDTVGGLLQQYPLEAIQEFNLLSQRFDAEYARGGAVMNIVTKSGTNAMRGSWFSLFRDDTLNARTFSEKLGDVDKQPYERYQFGGSAGGPIVLNRAHFFGAYERTNQDTAQVVDTGGIFPGDGIHDLQYRQDLFTGKVTSVLARSQYLAVRYGYEKNSQPSGAGRTVAPSAWATSTNTYHSINVNHNWAAGRSALNEFVFQFSNYRNDTPAESTLPSITLANGTHKGGGNANAPQSTEQRRLQFRNDYSWTMTGFGGLGHEFRTGVNYVYTPRLAVFSGSGTLGMLTMRTNDPDGGVATILLIGGTVNSNIPLSQYGVYLQDDWRVTDRLTLNLGVRWDYLDGLQIDQTSTNFQNMQAAGQTGRFEGTILEDFGKSPRGDWDNIQPRLGAVYDLRGDGRDILRGGWGIYTDMAYTNANVLTASLEGGGIVLAEACLSSSQASAICDPARGFTLPDGTLFHYTDPIAALGIPLSTPTTGEVVSPRLEQPFTYQSNVGWTHEINGRTSISVDYVNVLGRDLNMRIRPNVDLNPDPSVTERYLAGIAISPATNAFRTVISRGRSRYDALIFAGQRRMSRGFDLNASYTLAKSVSDVGTAYDELTQNLLQDINNPFSDFQLGPTTRTDARHRVTASAIVQAPYDIRVATTVSYRSALPITTLVGTDVNGDGQNNDHTTTAWAYKGLDDNGVATFEEVGECETVNCSRTAPFSQVNLRVSRSFRFVGTSRIEAIADVFNVFNAKNPYFGTSMTAPGPTRQPIAYAGDLGQGEQRIAQVGFRVTF